jgi:hypothetical protein
MAVDFRTSSLGIPSGTGRRSIEGTVTFSSPVLRANVTLNGFKLTWPMPRSRKRSRGHRDFLSPMDVFFPSPEPLDRKALPTYFADSYRAPCRGNRASELREPCCGSPRGGEEAERRLPRPVSSLE